MKTVMKSRWKKIVASILVTVMCVSTCMTFGGIVAKASQETLAIGDFKMVGASIRFEDEATVNGIRFGIGIKESVYSELDANVKSSIRLLVMPTKLVTGDLEIGETYSNGTATASAIDTAIGTKWELKTYADGNYYVTYVYLYDIDNTCYDFDVTARAYWKADDSSEVVYTDAIERSYIYVAEAALNDVATTESTEYSNAVGTKFSPYTPAQRDALIDVPYEQTANTTWDYVDGAFVKKGGDNSDHFIYDRRVDSSKDFKVYFTHKMQTGSYTGQTRFLNFGANEDGSQCFEFDFTETSSGSGVYKAHCRRIGTEGGFIETGHDFTFTSGETYDFLLNVTYSGNTMTADLQARVHDSSTSYKSVRSSKFSKTYNTLNVGTKFGYCLHAETRQATFEIEKGDVYRCNIYMEDGTTSRVASGVNVSELVEALQISGYTTSGNESYCMLLDRYTQPYATGANNANFTVTLDIVCDYSTTSSFAGFIVGNITGNDYGECGAHKRIRLFKTKLQVNGTAEFQLNENTMGETAYATYMSNIENGKPNTVKCVFTTDLSVNQTTIVGFVNGVQVGTCSFSATDIWENRIELSATDNATFSNLVIESVPEAYTHLDSHLSLTWTPDNEIAGSAAGAYLLSADSSSAYNTYELYYADEIGILTEYAPISECSLTSSEQVGYHGMIAQNVLPTRATRIVAAVNGQIKAYVDIPAEKQFQPGELLYTHAVFSDVHVFEDQTNSINGFDELPMAIKIVQDMGADFLSVTGDFIMDSNASSDLAGREFEVLKGILEQYDSYDIHVCKGNHDKVLSEEEWTSYWGYDMDYSFTYKGESFIYLSLLTANNVGSNDTVAYGDEKIEWLAQEMEKAAGNRVYLFMHYPFPEHAGLIPGNYYGFTSTSTEDDRILELIRQYDNTYVFSGHTHYDFDAQNTYSNITVTPIEGTNSYTVHVPSLAYPRLSSGSQISYESQGYFVEVYEDGIVLKGIDFKQDKKLIPYGCYYLENKVNPYYLSEGTTTLYTGTTTNVQILGQRYENAVWSSSDTNVVTVDQQGTLTGVMPGQAVVTAKVQNYILQVKVTVAESPFVNLPKTITLDIGEQGQCGLTGTYDTVTYSSTNDAVVSVGADGTIFAQGVGNAVITVTVEGMSYDITVTVIDAPNTYTGSGTLMDPYIISTATQFVSMQNAMENGETFSGKYFLQTADINLNYCSSYQPMTSSTGGTFSGTYNGNGYVLTVKTDPVSVDFAPPYFWYVNGVIVNTGFDIDLGGCSATTYGICRKFTSGGKLLNCYLVGDMVANNDTTTVLAGTSEDAIIDNMYTYVKIIGVKPGSSSGISIKGSNTVNRYYYVDNSCLKRYDGEVAVTVPELESLATTLNGNITSLSQANVSFCTWITKDGLPVMAHDGGYQ